MDETKDKTEEEKKMKKKKAFADALSSVGSSLSQKTDISGAKQAYSNAAQQIADRKLKTRR